MERPLSEALADYPQLRGPPGSDATVNNANVNAAILADRAATKAALALIKADLGLGNVDNTPDASKPVSTAQQAAINLAIANLIASAPGALDTINELATALGNDPNFATTITNALAGKQGSSATLGLLSALSTSVYGRGLLSLADGAALTALLVAATSLLPGAMSAQDKARLDAVHGVYRTLLDSSGSHTAARVAGTYGFGQGDPLAITGVGTLYPLNVLQIDSADYPSVGNLAPKLRVRVNVAVNDVAPTGNYTFGLHPVTRPATSGGAGLCIYTIGAAVAGSTVAVNAPAADAHVNAVGTDFALPANGLYVLGMVSTAAVATSSHLHASAALQLHHA